MNDKRDDLFGDMASDLDAAGDVTSELLGDLPAPQRAKPSKKSSPPRRGSSSSMSNTGSKLPRARRSKRTPERIPEGEPRSQPYGEHGATPGGLIKRTILVDPEIWDQLQDFKRDHRVRSVSEVVRYALEEYLERNS